MYKCKYFAIHELVPKSLYTAYGEWCWCLLDEYALRTLDALRERFGSLTVNNYKWNGTRKASGFRNEEYYGDAVKYAKSRSQHKYGRAFDFISKTYSAQEIRKYIVEHRDEFPYITFLEVGPLDDKGKPMNWVHFDTRNGDFTLWSPELGTIGIQMMLEENL